MNRALGLTVAVAAVFAPHAGTAQSPACPVGDQPNGEHWTGPFTSGLGSGTEWFAPNQSDTDYVGFCVSAGGEVNVVRLEQPAETLTMLSPNGSPIELVTFLKTDGVPPTTTTTVPPTTTTVPETTTTVPETTTTSTPGSTTTVPGSSTTTPTEPTPTTSPGPRTSHPDTGGGNTAVSALGLALLGAGSGIVWLAERKRRVA
jgi:hypothetical protein